MDKNLSFWGEFSSVPYSKWPLLSGFPPSRPKTFNTSQCHSSIYRHLYTHGGMCASLCGNQNTPVFHGALCWLNVLNLSLMCQSQSFCCSSSLFSSRDFFFFFILGSFLPLKVIVRWFYFIPHCKNRALRNKKYIQNIFFLKARHYANGAKKSSYQEFLF